MLQATQSWLFSQMIIKPSHLQVSILRIQRHSVCSVPHDGDWLGQGVDNRRQRPSLSVPRGENGRQPMTEPSIIAHYISLHLILSV